MGTPNHPAVDDHELETAMVTWGCPMTYEPPSGWGRIPGDPQAEARQMGLLAKGQEGIW